MDHTHAPNVAMQLATMWPHCRSYVTPTPTGYAVTFGSVEAELTPDWWTIHIPGQPDQLWGYAECDEFVIAETLATANAHNFRDSVKDRITAFDRRLRVRSIDDAYIITTAESETITIVPIGAMISVAATGITYEVATMGRAIMAVLTLVASTK